MNGYLNSFDLIDLPRLIPMTALSTPIDVFGSYYVGSTKWRHNQIKRKQRAKRK